MNEPPKRSPITTGGYIPWLVRAKYNAMGKRAMTEDIRKKHIVQKDYIERKQGNEPYLCQSIHSVISVADVDALLAALDAERGKVEKAIKALDRWVVLKRILADPKEVAELIASLEETPTEEYLKENLKSEILTGEG